MLLLLVSLNRGLKSIYRLQQAVKVLLSQIEGELACLALSRRLPVLAAPRLPLTYDFGPAI